MSNLGFVPWRFFSTYIPDPNDPSKTVAVDWCEYGPMALRDRSTTVERISRLKAVRTDNRDNPVVDMATMRWEQLRPHYEAWKKGQEAPTDGTPLAAWNGVTPEQAEVLRSRSIRTVEEVALITDAVRSRIPLPGLNDIIASAKRFVDSSDARIFSAQLAANDRKITEQQEQLADRDEQIRALMAKVDQLADIVASSGKRGDDGDGEEAPVRRGPGRPPKQAATAA